MPNDYKKVDFHNYCPKCKHAGVSPLDEPCYECMTNPVNLHSRKPVNFEEENNNENR